MFLVLNLGLKSIRSIIFDDQFNIISSSSRPLKTYLDNTIVEQCPKEWWSRGIEVINDSISRLNRSKKISSFTVTASSCCVVPTDASGVPLSRVIMVSDKRADLQNEKIKQLTEYKDLVAVGKTIASNTTLMLPKISWIKDNLSNVDERTKFYLSPNDYFIKRMSGVAVTDTLNAEKCGFIMADGRYPADLLSALNIKEEQLPNVVAPATVVGCVNNPDVPSELFGADVVVSTYDAICAFVGAGPSRFGDGCDVSGTVTSLRVLADANQSTEGSRNVFTQKEAATGIKICGASNNLGGGLIEWCKQAFYDVEKEAYGVMEAEATTASTNITDPIFLPYLMGERAPLWNDNARGVFFGLSRHHRRAHMTRAVFESAAFSLKLLSDEVEAITSVNNISVSGGLARLNIINQMKADVLNKEIKVLSEFETTAIGAYVYLLKSKNSSVTLSEVADNTKIRQVIIPDNEKHKIYLSRFELFKSTYQGLIESFDALASMEKNSVFQSKEIVENM